MVPYQRLPPQAQAVHPEPGNLVQRRFELALANRLTRHRLALNPQSR